MEGPRQQLSVLHHHAHLPAHGGGIDAGQVLTVEEDAAGLRGLEAQQQA